MEGCREGVEGKGGGVVSIRHCSHVLCLLQVGARSTTFSAWRSWQTRYGCLRQVTSLPLHACPIASFIPAEAYLRRLPRRLLSLARAVSCPTSLIKCGP